MGRELTLDGVYKDHRPKILSYLTRLAGEAEAEDLTQEVFLKVGKGLIGFRGESNLTTWIYRIATNTALDRFRRPGFKESGQDELSIISVERIDVADPWTGRKCLTVEEQAIQEEMSGCVRNVVDRLPEDCRTVIVLSDMEGFKDSEIADILGMGLPATKMRLHRARAELRKALSASCVFYRNEENELACDRKCGPEEGSDPELVKKRI
jgi:RNA polymerase sigma-70 factor (ECF subfamily)